MMTENKYMSSNLSYQDKAHLSTEIMPPKAVPGKVFINKELCKYQARISPRCKNMSAAKHFQSKFQKGQAFLIKLIS